MKHYHLKLFRHIIVSNKKTLAKAFAFYALTSILIFFVIILNDSLNKHISQLFPTEYFINAYLESGHQRIDITHRLFTPNELTLLNQKYNLNIQQETSQPEITLHLHNQAITVPYEQACCTNEFTVSEYFASLYPISVNDIVVVQGKYYRVNGIHSDYESSSQVLFPSDASHHINDGQLSIKVINNSITEQALKALLHHHFKEAHLVFDILSFDIEEALQRLVNLIFAVLLVVGILILIVASFNIRSMTIITITKRQREIVLYYFYGLPKKELLVLFQLESLCIQLFACMSSYLFSLFLIGCGSKLLQLAFSPAYIKSMLVCLLQLIIVQRITHKVLNTCIHESIAKI